MNGCKTHKCGINSYVEPDCNVYCYNYGGQLLLLCICHTYSRLLTEGLSHVEPDRWRQTGHRPRIDLMTLAFLLYVPL